MASGDTDDSRFIANLLLEIFGCSFLGSFDHRCYGGTAHAPPPTICGSLLDQNMNLYIVISTLATAISRLRAQTGGKESHLGHSVPIRSRELTWLSWSGGELCATILNRPAILGPFPRSNPPTYSGVLKHTTIYWCIQQILYG